MSTNAEGAAPQHIDVDAFVLGPDGPTLSRERVTLSPPRRGEVLVDVAACGVCHTDLHVMKSEVAFPKPAVMGHEVSGVVRAVGADVDRVSPGDRVACSFIMPCGTCRHCARGREDLCETFFGYNRLRGQLYDGTTRFSRRNGEPIAMYSMGGHARQCVAPERAVFRIPDSLRLSDAAVLGCSVFTAYGAVHTVGVVRPSETVVVVAAGGVGMSVVHLARAAGAERVLAVDLDDEKLALARRLGATDVVNSSGMEHAEIVDAVTATLGRGADVVVEAFGSTATARLAVDLVDDGGRVVLTGIAPTGHTLDAEITKIVRRKIRVLGSFGAVASEAMPEILAMAERGELDLESLITRRFAFTETDDAYRALDARGILGRGVIETDPDLR